MSSLALITQELHRRNGEAQVLKAAIEQLDQQAAVGILGSMSLTVTGCKNSEGKAVEDSKISVRANIEGKADSKMEGRCSEELKFQISSFEEVLVLTCYEEKMPAEEMGDGEEGVTEQASVASVPYCINFPVKDAKDMVTTELTGSCSETNETMSISIKVLLDETKDALESSKKELQQLEESISALQEAAKAAHTETQQAAVQERERKKQQGQGKGGAAGAGGAPVAQQAPKGPSFMEMGAQAAAVAYSMGSYLVFGGAVTVIYLYGDYASI